MPWHRAGRHPRCPRRRRRRRPGPPARRPIPAACSRRSRRPPSSAARASLRSPRQRPRPASRPPPWPAAPAGWAEEALKPGRDPWEQLAGFIRDCVSFRAGVLSAVAGTIPVTDEMKATAGRAHDLLERVVRRPSGPGPSGGMPAASTSTSSSSCSAGGLPATPTPTSGCWRWRLTASGRLAPGGCRALPRNGLPTSGDGRTRRMPPCSVPSARQSSSRASAAVRTTWWTSSSCWRRSCPTAEGRCRTGPGPRRRAKTSGPTRAWRADGGVHPRRPRREPHRRVDHG